MTDDAKNAGRLRNFLRANGLPATAEPRLRALAGGQSNPTSILSVGDWQCVLRTKPTGVLAASAHAIDREFRAMEALRDSPVPVPRMLAYCHDSDVFGREFYLMEFVRGRVFVDQSLPDLRPFERRAIYEEMNRVIAQLHTVDHQAVGLGEFGKPGNYFGRQIARWSRQCRDSTMPLAPALCKLMEWLPEHIPDGGETTLVHGDYRLDNLVFHPTEARIIAVLDWELSTIGHPLADFAYHCMAWHIPASLWRGVAGLDLQTLGIPSEAQYVQMYAQRTGRSPGEHWFFYMAYNLFRMAAILHGIAERALAGNAAGSDAAETGKRAEPLAELGWACAQQYVHQ